MSRVEEISPHPPRCIYNASNLCVLLDHHYEVQNRLVPESRQDNANINHPETNSQQCMTERSPKQEAHQQCETNHDGVCLVVPGSHINSTRLH